MNKTENILARLRCQQPEISNPDELTSLIMSRLDDADMQKTAGGRRAIVRTLYAVSAMAAVWLIGMFVVAGKPTEHQQNTNIAIIQATHTSRGETLKKMYAARQQKYQSKQLSYTQLKRMLYENR